MKLVLQDVNSNVFTEAKTWNNKEEEALIFPSTRAAVKFCTEQQFKDVSVIAIFRDGSRYVRSRFPAAEKKPLGAWRR